MKRAGLLIAILLVLCSFGTQKSSAQGPTYGYIPLLTADYNPSIPREIQSREFFMHLQHTLIKAQENGLISDFEPDFYGGYVQISNPTDAFRKSINTMLVKANLKDAIVRPRNSEEKPLRGESGFMAYAHIYSNCFDFSNAGANVVIKGTLKTPSGLVVGASKTTADATGWAWDCFYGPSPRVIPGYTLVFKVFDGGTLLNTYSVVAPKSTYDSLVKSTGAVAGTGMAGKPYVLRWEHKELDAGNNWTSHSLSGTVPADGKWSGVFGPGMRGGDEVAFYLQRSDYFTFNDWYHVPILYSELNDNWFELDGLPNKAVTINVTHGGVTRSFSGKTNKWGYFWDYLEDTSGNPLLLVPGDKISGTGAATETLPELTMEIDKLTDTVTGKSIKYAWFWVEVYLPMSGNYYDIWTHADSSGNYTADFNSYGIPDEELVIGNLWVYRKATGNYTTITVLAP